MQKQFSDLASDNTSGATELIHRLLGVCESYLMAGRYTELESGIHDLFPRQLGLPSFHAVLHILERDLFPLMKGNADSAAPLAYIASLQLLLDESATRIANNFISLLDAPKSILTMSRSSTVIDSTIDAYAAGKVRELFVMESRPMMEGVKTIRDFDRRNIPSTLVIDAAVAEAVPCVDMALVGADGVSADGFLLNKTGTHVIAALCRTAHKPFYVLCDSLKFSPQLREDIVLENHPDDEVVHREEKDRFHVWNRYFEWTPIDLVTAFITEKGVFPPDRIAQLVSP